MVGVADSGCLAYHEVREAHARAVSFVGLPNLCEGGELALKHVVAVVVGHGVDGLRPLLLYGRCHCLYEHVVGLVPGDALELALDTLLVCTAHGVFNAIGVVDDGHRCHAARTQAPLVLCRGATLVVHDLAVFYICLPDMVHASGVAAGADGGNDLVGPVGQAVA